MKKIRMIDEGADLHHLVIFGKDVWMNDKDIVEKGTRQVWYEESCIR